MRNLCLIFITLCLLPVPVSALTLAGTGDSEMLLRRLATEFTRAHPEIAVEVPSSVGSSGGIRMLLQGRTDLARVARPLHAAEVQQGLQLLRFAVVPIVFVANLPQGCISNLSSRQILDIFAGRISRWSQLGSCPDHKIYLARREDGDSSNRILLEKIAGLSKLKNPVGKKIYTTPETFKIIAAHPYTLGYLPLPQLKDSSLTIFSLDGVGASAKTISSGRYPLQLTLGLARKGSLSEDARKFISFLGSPVAQEMIGSFGAVPTPPREF